MIKGTQRTITAAMSLLAPILLTILLYSIRPSDAFSIPPFQGATAPAISTATIKAKANAKGRRNSSSNNRCNFNLSMSSSPEPSLPSTYDISLPASLRGEAVRAALKSDRGACIDFTDDNHAVKNVGVVKVTGTAKSTYDFLNNKLSNSFPGDENDGRHHEGNVRIPRTEVHDISPTCRIKIQHGRLREAGLLTPKGRIIDRLLVASFAAATGGDEDGDGIVNVGSQVQKMEAYMITSPGHNGSQLFDRLDPFIFPLDGVKLTDMCPTKSDSRDKRRNQSTSVYTFAATDIRTVQNCIRQSVLPTFSKQFNAKLDNDSGESNSIFAFPKSEQDCIRYVFSSRGHDSASKSDDTTGSDSDTVEITIFENTFLPSCVARGYTVMISESSNYNSNMNLANKVWDWCTSDSNMQGPVALGPLEYETLRIEGGQPAFGFEMTGSCLKSKAGSAKDDIDHENKSNGKRDTKAGPLELHLDHLVDEQKGCYQGQEGVAAMLKNKRGLPQLLYSIIFPEEDNFYDDGQRDEEKYSNHDSPERVKNKTALPQVGDILYVLGSNLKIKVGTISSIAERSGTSLPETVGLTLVRRSDGILEKMSKMDLEIERNDFMGPNLDFEDPMDDDVGSGIIYPPPIDPLDGLDVVLDNGFTRGYLRAIPSRRLKSGQNIFEVEQWSIFDEQQTDTGSVMGFISNEAEDWATRMNIDMGTSTTKEKNQDSFTDDDSTRENTYSSIAGQPKPPGVPLAEESVRDDNDDDEEELKAAIAAAQQAADEAKRKEEKLAMLKKRAEEAMEKRTKAKEAVQKEREMKSQEKEKEEGNDNIAAEAEARRKAEKMELLRLRAEEAIARRTKRQQ